MSAAIDREKADAARQREMEEIRRVLGCNPFSVWWEGLHSHDRERVWRMAGCVGVTPGDWSRMATGERYKVLASARDCRRIVDGLPGGITDDWEKPVCPA